MKGRKSLIVLLASITCAILLSACEVKIPIKEMAAAKNGIEDAKKYDAEKYASDEIKNAEALLIQSHANIIDDKADAAQKSANDALLAANNAKNKSLPPYADDQIKKSNEMHNLAEKAYAERFSPNNFAQGKNFNSEAKSQYEQGDYLKSIESAENSSASFTAAINDSLKNSSSISNDISSTEKRLSDLKRDKNSNAASTNLTKAENSIKNAKKSFGDKDFKASWVEIDSAKKELDTASQIINKQRISLSIADIRNDIKSISVTGVSQDITRDLDAATTELNGADLSLGQNNIRDAETRVKRAEDLVSSAKIKIKKDEATTALNKVESQLAQARSKDRDKKYADNLDKAENLIKSGKAFAAAGKFADAINNADEAENIISTALNSMETDAINVAVSSTADQDEDTLADYESMDESDKKAEKGRTYIVQWKKKDADCLWKISQKFYKDASFWPAIYIANKDQIKDPDLIFPGQKLIIPPKPNKRPVYKKN